MRREVMTLRKSETNNDNDVNEDSIRLEFSIYILHSFFCWEGDWCLVCS